MANPNGAIRTARRVQPTNVFYIIFDRIIFVNFFEEWKVSEGSKHDQTNVDVDGTRYVLQSIQGGWKP